MILFIVILLLPFLIYGDGLSEGQSLASTANQKIAGIKQGGAGQLGVSIQERPKEAGYYNADTLGQKAAAQKASEDYVHIKDSYNAMEEEVVVVVVFRLDDKECFGGGMATVSMCDF